MNRPPNPTVPVVFAALSVTGVVFAIVGGSNLGMAAFGLAVAVVAGVLAVASWRTTRAVTAARPASGALVAGPSRRCRGAHHDDRRRQHHRRGPRRMVAPDDAHPPRRHHDDRHRAHPRHRPPRDPPAAQRNQLTVRGWSPPDDGRPPRSERPCIACPDRRASSLPSSPWLFGCGDSGTNRPNTADIAADAETRSAPPWKAWRSRLARDTDRQRRRQRSASTSTRSSRCSTKPSRRARQRSATTSPPSPRPSIAYVVALADADYDLDVIFSTPEGTRLAEDTSHALTPDVVNHMTGPCGITLE